MAAIIGQALTISRQQGANGNSEASTNGPQPTKVSAFNPKTVGYFDPYPNKAPIEAKDGGYNIYHNVFSFTVRLRVKETSIDKTLLT